MGEATNIPSSIDCWACGTYMTLDEHSENDGYCPECNAEIDLDPYLAKAIAGYAARDARISALEFELEVAKTDELSAAVWAATETIKHDLWDAQAELADAKETISRYETTAENCDVLRAELAAMTNTIPNVPRELLERVLNAGWGSETVNAIDDLRDFLESAPSPANHSEDVRAMVVPDGYKLVPIDRIAELSESIEAVDRISHASMSLAETEQLRQYRLNVIRKARALLAASPPAKDASQ